MTHAQHDSTRPRRILTLGEIIAGSLLMTLTVVAYLAAIGLVAYIAVKGMLTN